MLKHLREKGLPEAAERRGLHSLAEDEVAKILGPTKAALDRVIENQLLKANLHLPNQDERSNAGSHCLQLEPLRFDQASAGVSSTAFIGVIIANTSSYQSRNV